MEGDEVTGVRWQNVSWGNTIQQVLGGGGGGVACRQVSHLLASCYGLLRTKTFETAQNIFTADKDDKGDRILCLLQVTFPKFNS